MRCCAYVLTLFSSLAVSAALAHGPQLQVTNDGGKIITREILTDTYHPLTSAKSVYVMPVLEHQGAWYARPETEVYPSGHLLEGQPMYYSGPGLAYGVNQSFDEGVVLSLRFLDYLKLWNGNEFLNAVPIQLQSFRGGSIGASGELINPTASSFSGTPSIALELDFAPIATGYDEQAHATARLRFLGDGGLVSVGSGTSVTEPADGVYLATFVVASTQDNLMPSDPFYFVMHKHAEWSDVVAAVRSLGVPASQVQYLGVPEPGSLALASIAAIGVIIWLRRKG